jgi:isopentenyldiphosphate isomerase
MEYIDIYDKFKNPTGIIRERHAKINEDEHALTVHICIFSSDDKMLIQQRQPTKKMFPNYWGISVSGGVMAGETSQIAATRELGEELGINNDFEDFYPNLMINNKNFFEDFYIVKKDIDIANLKLQEEEVNQVKWATKDEIIKLIKFKKFIPFYYEDLISLLFKLEKNFK